MLHKNTSVLASDFKVTVVDSREKRSTEIIDTTIYKGYLDGGYFHNVLAVRGVC